MNTIPGRLDIQWANHVQATATPWYWLTFARDENYRDGTQPHYALRGEEGLESYLVQIGFKPQDAKDWTKRVRESQQVSIFNVMMPAEEMGRYERSDPLTVRLDSAAFSRP